jgi:hypothetical protein
VHEYGRFSFGIAALLVVDGVFAVRRQIAVVVGFQSGIERTHELQDAISPAGDASALRDRAT